MILNDSLFARASRANAFFHDGKGKSIILAGIFGLILAGDTFAFPSENFSGHFPSKPPLAMGAHAFGVVGSVTDADGNETDYIDDGYGILVITSEMTDDAYACGRKLALKMVREYISTHHHNPTEKTYYDEKPVLQYFSKEARKRYTNRRFLNWFVIDSSGAYDTAFRLSIQSGLGAFTAKELQAGDENE